MRFVSLVFLVALLVACQPQPAPPEATESAAAATTWVTPTEQAMPTLSAEPATSQAPDTATPSRSAVRVHVEPPTSLLQVGQIARVAVVADGVQDLQGVELYLTFDPAILNVLDDNPNEPNLQVNLGNLVAADFVALNRIEPGKISAVFLQLPPRQPVSGSGQLIAFTVEAHAPGTSALTLEGVKLADKSGDPIPVRVEHGQVVVK